MRVFLLLVLLSTVLAVLAWDHPTTTTTTSTLPVGPCPSPCQPCPDCRYEPSPCRDFHVGRPRLDRPGWLRQRVIRLCPTR